MYHLNWKNAGTDKAAHRPVLIVWLVLLLSNQFCSFFPVQSGLKLPSVVVLTSGDGMLYLGMAMATRDF